MDCHRAVPTLGTLVTAGAMLVSLMTSDVVLAQPPAGDRPAPSRPSRVVLGVDIGSQTMSFSRADAFAFELFAENSVLTATQEVGPDRVLDGGLSVRLVKWLGLGVATSHVAGTETAVVTADVPHPFFFDFDRPTVGAAPGLRHEELAVHGQLQVWFPLWSSGRLTFGFGPTYFDATQDIATEITTAEVGFPFDEVQIASHTTERVALTDIGYHVSLDLSYFGLRRIGVLSGVGALDHLGLGLMVRYSRATPEVSAGGVRQSALELGGVHVAGGIRLGF